MNRKNNITYRPSDAVHRDMEHERQKSHNKSLKAAHATLRKPRLSLKNISEANRARFERLQRNQIRKSRSQGLKICREEKFKLRNYSENSTEDYDFHDEDTQDSEDEFEEDLDDVSSAQEYPGNDEDRHYQPYNGMREDMYNSGYDATIHSNIAEEHNELLASSDDRGNGNDTTIETQSNGGLNDPGYQFPVNRFYLL